MAARPPWGHEDDPVGEGAAEIAAHQRPEPFATALRAAKDALDPAGRLSPGVLLDP